MEGPASGEPVSSASVGLWNAPPTDGVVGSGDVDGPAKIEAFGSLLTQGSRPRVVVVAGGGGRLVVVPALGWTATVVDDAMNGDEVVDAWVVAVIGAVLVVDRPLGVIEVVVIGTRMAGTSWVGCSGSGPGLMTR